MVDRRARTQELERWSLLSRSKKTFLLSNWEHLPLGAVRKDGFITSSPLREKANSSTRKVKVQVWHLKAWKPHAEKTVISLCGLSISSIQKVSALQKHQNTLLLPVQTTLQKDALLLLLNLNFSVIYWHIIFLPYSNLNILNMYYSKCTISNF